MLCCWPGGEAAGQVGLKAPCWGSGGAGGGGEVAMEATGLLLLKLSEALRRENMVRASGKLGGVAGVLAGVHICGKETRVRQVVGGCLHLLPPTRAQHKTPLSPLLQHAELPDPCSADDAAHKQQLFKALKTNAVARAPGPCCTQPRRGHPLLHNPLVPPWPCSFLAQWAQGSGSAPTPQETGCA